MRRPVVAFLRARRGAAAVEFALLAVPFFAIVFMMLETALVILAQIALDNAVERTARQVQTGQVQGKALSQAAFRTLLCAQAKPMLSCDRIVFDLKTYADFSQIPRGGVASGASPDTTGFGYQPPGPQTISALRVFYKWPLSSGFGKRYLATTSDDARVLASMWAFQSEPF